MQPNGSQDNINRYLEQLALAAKVEAGFIRGSLKNRAFSSGNLITPVTGGAIVPATVNVMAALLAVKTSGIFMTEVSLAFAQATPGTYRLQVSTQTVVSGMTLTNNTKVGPGTGAATNGVFAASAPTGITVNAGGGTLIQYDTGVQTIGTAATGTTVEWSGLIQNSITATAAEAPFTVGSQILVVATLIVVGQNITAFPGAAMMLVEML